MHTRGTGTTLLEKRTERRAPQHLQRRKKESLSNSKGKSGERAGKAAERTRLRAQAEARPHLKTKARVSTKASHLEQTTLQTRPPPTHQLPKKANDRENGREQGHKAKASTKEYDKIDTSKAKAKRSNL